MFFTALRPSNPSVKNQRFLPAVFIEQLPLAIVYPNRFAILTQGCARRRVQSATVVLRAANQNKLIASGNHTTI